MKIEAATRLLATTDPKPAMKFFRKLGLKVDPLPKEIMLPTAGGMTNSSDVELLGSRSKALATLSTALGQPKQIKRRGERYFMWTHEGKGISLCVPDDNDTMAYLRLVDIPKA